VIINRSRKENVKSCEKDRIDEPECLPVFRYVFVVTCEHMMSVQLHDVV